MPAKPLNQKLADYYAESFATWLQKTNIVAEEEGDLNNLTSTVLTELNTNNLAHNLVNAINALHDFTARELRNVLIKSIGMS